MTPGIIIASTHSGAGKTTISLGIMSILAKRGYQVQGFKVGPDYIDPSFYHGVTGRLGENLDSWMTPPPEIRRIYQEGSRGADVAVVEGVMGLFDGAKGNAEIGSTAEIAKILDLPVIFVIDARSMARSVAALIKGFMEFDSQLRFGGIIFNRVGSIKHFHLLQEAAQSVTSIKIIGHLAKETNISLPERHLGLVPFYEHPEFGAKLEESAALFEQTLDIASLEQIIKAQKDKFFNAPDNFIQTGEPMIRIGVARDEAFGFYYQANLRLLQQAGAEIIDFSPLHDSKVPANLDGVYLGGGYPEMFAAQLAANESLRHELQSLIGQGLPTYAECGGLMYLSNQLKTAEGVYSMLGVLPLEIEMTSRRETLGYVTVTALEDNLLFKKGQQARGHEYHYSKISKSPEMDKAYQAFYRDAVRTEGYTRINLLASYIHLHFGSNPAIADNFMGNCLKYKRSQNRTA